MRGCISGTTEKLKEHALAGAVCIPTRSRHLAAATARELDQKSIHSPREARSAMLEVSATSVELRRSDNHTPGVPPSLQVNVVTVQETNCPKGMDPVTWFLVTTEPVQTRSQLEFIVDAYRARWVVEEFFKALKTGCRFEQRQLESFKSLDGALAIFLPIAVRLLARVEPPERPRHAAAVR